jgi:hypothetical protein
VVIQNISLTAFVLWLALGAIVAIGETRTGWRVPAELAMVAWAVAALLVRVWQ